jgi:glycosyltransferase involved in cell wall biosynthesis
LIFPEDDVGALRGQLQRLMHDSELDATLARRGRERVLARFTQAHIATQTVEVYRALTSPVSRL